MPSAQSPVLTACLEVGGDGLDENGGLWETPVKRFANLLITSVNPSHLRYNQAVYCQPICHALGANIRLSHPWIEGRVEGNSSSLQLILRFREGTGMATKELVLLQITSADTGAIVRARCWIW